MTATSCDDLAEDCGPEADENCCATILVPGGSYSRSYDGYDPWNDPQYLATLDSFCLDRFEVTVGRFRAFVESGAGTQDSPPPPNAGAHPLISGSGWDPGWNATLPADTAALMAVLLCQSDYATWTDSPGASDTLPINCVNWYLAFAFCAWDGGRLPTEAEWNYAASGGDQQRCYPWPASCPPTNIDYTHAVYDCMGDGVSGCSFSDILPVGSRSPEGDGRWGQADLAGGMWEWNLDWYENPYPSTSCDNCSNLVPASSCVERGGCWSTHGSLRAARRDDYPPAGRHDGLGLRCARSP